MRRIAPLIAILVTLTWASESEAARCEDKRGRSRVFVMGKTPLRRGPGLNYGVASFLGKGRCAVFSEVSLDESWVLIEVDRSFGWVPVKRLATASRRKLARTGTTGPVGSGQRRGTARLFRQSVLLERPDPDAPVRRVLPENLRVLPLAVTREGGWTQIRDERGDVGWVASSDLVGDSLANLPRTDTVGVDRRRRRMARASQRRERDDEAASIAAAAELDATDGDVRIAVFGAALNPVHSLDSNGVEAIRRYDLSAASAGASLEVEVPRLGPLSGRVGYTIAFLNGLTNDDADGAGAGGMQHDVYARLGWPVALGGVRLTPEVGYHFGMFDFDSVLLGQQQVVFLSTQSHLGLVGLRLQVALLDGLIFDADASGMFGITQETPENLGDAGLTLGVAGQLGARYMLGQRWSIIFRYAINYRSTGYTGEAQLDPTITEATLVDLSHGLLGGVAIDL